MYFKSNISKQNPLIRHGSTMMSDSMG